MITLFGRSNRRRALLPRAHLDWDAIQRVTSSAEIASAARRRSRQSYAGTVRHVGGLRDSCLALCGNRWAARTEVAALFHLVARPPRMPRSPGGVRAFVLEIDD